MSNRAEAEAKLIHIGATVSELAHLFGLSRRVVEQRITGRVTPNKVKGQSERDSLRYLVKDAAPFLCDPQVNIEELIKSITPTKLPPALTDVFWKGQKSRIEVEEKLGNLWNTERVVGVIADAFKPMRMAIMMFVETVESENVLTPEQREKIVELSDGLMNSLHHALVKQFKDYRPAVDEHGALIGTETLMRVDAEEIAELTPVDDGFGDD